MAFANSRDCQPVNGEARPPSIGLFVLKAFVLAPLFALSFAGVLLGLLTILPTLFSDASLVPVPILITGVSVLVHGFLWARPFRDDGDGWLFWGIVVLIGYAVIGHLCGVL